MIVSLLMTEEEEETLYLEMNERLIRHLAAPAPCLGENDKIVLIVTVMRRSRHLKFKMSTGELRTKPSSPVAICQAITSVWLDQ